MTTYQVLVDLSTLQENPTFRRRPDGGYDIPSGPAMAHFVFVYRDGLGWRRQEFAGRNMNEMSLTGEDERHPVLGLPLPRPEGWINRYWTEQETRPVYDLGDSNTNPHGHWTCRYVPTTVTCRHCSMSFLHTECENDVQDDPDGGGASSDAVCPQCRGWDCCDLDYESIAEALQRQARIDNYIRVRDNFIQEIGAATMATYHAAYPVDMTDPPEFDSVRFVTFFEAMPRPAAPQPSLTGL